MRVKQMKLDGQGMSDFLRHPNQYDIIPRDQIPRDLEILEVERLIDGHAFESTFIMLLHSEEWPDIPPGMDIPVWEPVKKKP